MSMFCVVGDFDLKEKNNLMSRKHTKKRSDSIGQIFFVLAGATGIEPAISALTGPHVSHYTTPPNNQKFTIRHIQRQGILRLILRLILSNWIKNRMIKGPFPRHKK